MSSEETNGVTSDLPIRCACGAVEGRLTDVSPDAGTRVVCYCGSCQAFPEALGRAAETLDAQGGSEIFQTAAGRLTFSKGQEHLACLTVTEKGLLRWYAACCNTPIGNTMASPALPFVGLLHTSQGEPADGRTRDAVLGPVRTRVHVGSARVGPDGDTPKAFGLLTAIKRFAQRMLAARLTGRYRESPFFDASGAPIAKPRHVAPSETIAAPAD